MKKRRTLIISLLLIAALALGIGYANVVATNLFIDGVARINPNQSNINVIFDKNVAVTSTNAALANGSINENNPTEASIDAVGFTTGGENATVTYTIKNDGVYDVTLKIETNTPQHVDGEEELFHVASTLKEIAGTTLDKTSDGTFILRAGQSITAEVYVELNETVTTVQETTIKVTVTATPIDTPAA